MKPHISIKTLTSLFSITLALTNALGGDTKEGVKEFGGDFQTGVYFKCGDSFRMAPIFMDQTRPAVIKAADDKISDSLLKDICENGDDLRGAPALAHQMHNSPFDRWKDALHIAVFPLASIPVGEKLKGTARFEPGPITKVDEVSKKYGKPLEQERWTAKEFQNWLGLNGTVSWWGAVGVAASTNGTITHLFIREKESVADPKK